jgi:hypothetical protein
MYQSTFSIASSEIRPTAWLRRCIVTYASITKPEKSRSRRIIEAPSEGAVESRICSYRRPVSFVWVGADKHHRDRWVAKAPPSAEHHVPCEEGGLPNAVSITIGSRRGALSRRLRLNRNDFRPVTDRDSVGPPLPFDRRRAH